MPKIKVFFIGISQKTFISLVVRQPGSDVLGTGLIPSESLKKTLCEENIQISDGVFFFYNIQILRVLCVFTLFVSFVLKNGLLPEKKILKLPCLNLPRSRFLFLRKIRNNLFTHFLVIFDIVQGILTKQTLFFKKCFSITEIQKAN